MPTAKVINAAMPPIVAQWFGANASVGQGILSIGLTAVVIFTAFLAKMVQVGETKNKLAYNRKLQQGIMRETLARRTQQELQINTANRLVLLLRHKDAEQAGMALKRIQQSPCEILQNDETMSIVLYPTVEAGLEAIKQSSLWVTERLRRLRPIDAKPDYRFILHAINDETHPQEAAQMCQGLEVFCKSPSMLCTQSVSDAIKLRKLPAELTSLGYYDLSKTQNTLELFKLEIN